MNNNLYNTSGFIPNQGIIPQNNNYNGNYVEDYLRGFISHNVEAHVSFCDSIEWRDSVFTGILEAIGKDYIVIRNSSNKYVIWNIYLDYLILTDNNR